MPIRDYAVMDEFLEYSGPFELREFYLLIDHFIKNHHYDKKEVKHYEKRTEEERYIELVLEPFKTISEFMKLAFELEIFIRNLKDIKVDVGEEKKTIQQGDVTIRFRAWVHKDYGELWERRPFLFFWRTLADKFIYRMHLAKFTDEVAGDVRLLRTSIKSFLNLYQRR